MPQGFTYDVIYQAYQRVESVLCLPSFADLTNKTAFLGCECWNRAVNKLINGRSVSPSLQKIFLKGEALGFLSECCVKSLF